MGILCIPNVIVVVCKQMFQQLSCGHYQWHTESVQLLVDCRVNVDGL